MSDETRGHVDMFWELINEILNAVLFVLIGIEVLLAMFSATELAAAGVAIAVRCSASHEPTCRMSRRRLPDHGGPSP